MDWMDSAEIRSRFLRFFEERGHTVVPSASPDRSTTRRCCSSTPAWCRSSRTSSASRRRRAPRATSVQKCVRTLDIDEVGKTTRHASFFQMAGNFSFGDYFKDGAIPLAWELLTEPGRDGGFGFARGPALGHRLPRRRRGVGIWHDNVGVPAERIQRRGKADNYWSMGVPGPGGPCSRDLLRPRPRVRRRGRPDRRRGALPRGLEPRVHAGPSWRRSQPRSTSPSSGELPAKNIDTGMGLERMATILQGVENLYEIDTTRHDPGPRRRAHRLEVRRRPRLRRPAARRRRPRPHLRVCSSTTASRPATRAAATCCAGSCAASCATCGCSARPEHDDRRAGRARHRRDGPAVPRAARRRRPDPPGQRPRRRRRSCPRCAPAPRSSTPRSARSRRTAARRCRATQAFAAARHVRLPHRPHPGDGVRGRARPSTRTASAS